MNCSAATSKLSEEEISERLSRLSEWSRGPDFIEKNYEFQNFLRAMLFVNAVAYVAQSMGHHPDIVIHYNRVTLRNWTHTAGGLTEYDFALAEKIDALIERDNSS